MGRRLWDAVPLVWRDEPANRDGLILTLHPRDGWTGLLDRQASEPPTRLVYIENTPRRDEYGMPYVGIRQAVDDGGEVYYEVRVRADTPSGTRYRQCESVHEAQRWAENWFNSRFGRPALRA